MLYGDSVAYPPAETHRRQSAAARSSTAAAASAASWIRRRLPPGAGRLRRARPPACRPRSESESRAARVPGLERVRGPPGTAGARSLRSSRRAERGGRVCADARRPCLCGTVPVLRPLGRRAPGSSGGGGGLLRAGFQGCLSMGDLLRAPDSSLRESSPSPTRSRAAAPCGARQTEARTVLLPRGRAPSRARASVLCSEAASLSAKTRAVTVT